MIYTLTEIALIASVMTLGSVVQGAVGFASGLIGVPLLVLSGFSLPEAATINLVSTSVQNVTGAWKLRPHLELRELVFPVVVRWLAIPCGTYVAYIADQRLAPDQAKQFRIRRNNWSAFFCWPSWFCYGDSEFHPENTCTWVGKRWRSPRQAF